MRRKIVWKILTTLIIASFMTCAASVSAEIEETETVDIQMILNELEYDEVAAAEENYLILYHHEKSFDINEHQYGVYNIKEKKWDLEYQVLPGTDGKEGIPEKVSADGIIEFTYNKYGVFSYNYINRKTNTVTSCFISAEKGLVFSYELETPLEEIVFDEGYPLVLFEGTEATENTAEKTALNCFITTFIGTEAKTVTNAGWLTPEGELHLCQLSGYDGSTADTTADFSLYNIETNIEHVYGHLVYDAGVHTEEDKKPSLFLPWPGEESYILITDPLYTGKIEEKESTKQVTSEKTDVTEVIYFKQGNNKYAKLSQIKGLDGMYYTTIFDENGNALFAPFCTIENLPKINDTVFLEWERDDSELEGIWEAENGDCTLTFSEEGLLNKDEKGKKSDIIYKTDKELHILIFNNQNETKEFNTEKLPEYQSFVYIVNGNQLWIWDNDKNLPVLFHKKN